MSRGGQGLCTDTMVAGWGGRVWLGCCRGSKEVLLPLYFPSHYTELKPTPCSTASCPDDCSSKGNQGGGSIGAAGEVITLEKICTMPKIITVS